MDIMAKIQELLIEHKKTQKELSFYLGMKPQAFSEWKAGRNTSYMKKLPEIAKFFDVSIDVFFDDPALQQQKKPALNEDELDSKEQEILTLLRAVPEDRREEAERAVMALIAGLKDRL